MIPSGTENMFAITAQSLSYVALGLGGLSIVHDVPWSKPHATKIQIGNHAATICADTKLVSDIPCDWSSDVRAYL